jgi:hypothetical protein
MKITILTLISLGGMVFGGMMMVFENTFGDYVTVASAFLGLYLMAKGEKEYSEEGFYEENEPRKWNGGSN